MLSRVVQLLTLVVCLPLAGSACVSSAGTAYTPPPPVQHDSTLGQGDVFKVTVYGQKDLSGEYRVSADGTIDFPLVGPIAVLGKDQSQVAGAIKNALQQGEFLKNPHVSVLVTEMESKRVTVVGSVDAPGSFNVTQGMTVVQVISLAGGFTQLANRNGTIVTRRVKGKVQRFKVPVERITEGRTDDVEVQAGDTIYVPERLF
ncbi:MAG: polysaccharide export protein [Myxococcales bacterium]|nr:polysaccharide export protein [Myxococcales bacterium]MDD9969788.1 polysaccharide export protein [Myxococcales bacterium]